MDQIFCQTNSCKCLPNQFIHHLMLYHLTFYHLRFSMRISMAQTSLVLGVHSKLRCVQNYSQMSLYGNPFCTIKPWQKLLFSWCSVLWFIFNFISLQLQSSIYKGSKLENFFSPLCEDCKFHNLCRGRGFCVYLYHLKACMNDP